MNDIERTVADVTAAYRAGMGLPALKPYRKAPCGSLVKFGDYQSHIEECEFCINGGNVFDRQESEERRLDSPTHVPYSNLWRK